MFNANDAQKEYDEIIQQLGDPKLISDWERLEELNKRKSFLEKVIEKNDQTNEIAKKIEENNSIINSGDDPELMILAQTENEQLKQQKNAIENELSQLIASQKPSGPQAVIVEIRAGAGGEEAALFAQDLYLMYSKYAQKLGLTQKVLDENHTDIGGIKEIIFELKGPAAWTAMRYEAGVHRIQRIPITEKNGRIHTSTATVAVLPKSKKGAVKIRPEDIRVDFCRSSGPGGQFVNKRESAVRITHLPTGLAVFSQTERNQLQNRENAMALLEYRLEEKQRAEEEAAVGDARKEQIGGAKRAEKIRTYNVPQDRITDHRIKHSWHNIEDIFAGNLENINKTLQEEYSQNNSAQN